MSDTPLEMLMDSELIAILRRRGYVVRHESEAAHPLRWSRSMPIPDGLDFKTEALAKIRESITSDLIRFDIIPSDQFRPGVQRATLLVL